MKKETILNKLQEATAAGNVKNIVKYAKQLEQATSVKAKPKPAPEPKPKPEPEIDDSEVIDAIAVIKPKKQLKIARTSSWRKPKKIKFTDLLDEVTEDIELDKILKPKKLTRETNKRPPAKQITVKCPVCGRERLEWEHNLYANYDEFEKKTELVGTKCNGCR